jgi:hypothetical protein
MLSTTNTVRFVPKPAAAASRLVIMSSLRSRPSARTYEGRGASALASFLLSFREDPFSAIE